MYIENDDWIKIATILKKYIIGQTFSKVQNDKLHHFHIKTSKSVENKYCC